MELKIRDPNSFEQKAFAVLVRQAQIGQTITYKELNDEIGYVHYRNIGKPLLFNIARELKEIVNEEIPAIQMIVVNAKTHLPGPGVEKTGVSLKNPTALMQEVFKFMGWNKILYKINPDLVIKTIAQVINKKAQIELEEASPQEIKIGKLQEYRRDKYAKKRLAPLKL